MSVAYVGSAIVIDADDAPRAALATMLEKLHLTVEGAANRRVALGLLSERVSDVIMVAASLCELVTELTAEYPDAHVVVVAGDDPSVTLEALRLGAADVLHDPSSASALRRVLDKVLAAVERIEGPPHAAGAKAQIIGSTPAMAALMEKISRVASTEATVLIRGESGTGKELVAQHVHDQSERTKGPFVKVHCAALPDALLESELFGYKKGAFTGATVDKPGRVALAEGGTLFLDEIGDVPLPMQVKLLRLLQERQYEPLGDNQPRDADVRFVTATHRDLEGMVKRGEFREDLFYRLNVVPLWVPPLRTRRGDIAKLAERFVASFSERYKRPMRLDDGAITALKAHRWPGNVRQLQNLVERLVVLGSGERIDETAVRRELETERAPLTQPGSLVSAGNLRTRSQLVVSRISTSGEVVPLSESLKKAERAAIERALKRTKGNRSLAAKLLGVSRGTLYNKLEIHGLR